MANILNASGLAKNRGVRLLMRGQSRNQDTDFSGNFSASLPLSESQSKVKCADKADIARVLENFWRFGQRPPSFRVR
ncbi:hypothetical protein RUM4293_03121 [Ruegeria atlantica]|uniref:Uncharacterized protein n=1 Tax=Ruegeria atlantica TaxID=81569 RepID=A0A0P1E5Z2_9RHOB|nr:hypothetical protein RUM4293_03121 [Ruegeria atlantica]